MFDHFVVGIADDLPGKAGLNVRGVMMADERGRELSDQGCDGSDGAGACEGGLPGPAMEGADYAGEKRAVSARILFLANGAQDVAGKEWGYGGGAGFPEQFPEFVVIVRLHVLAG